MTLQAVHATRHQIAARAELEAVHGELLAFAHQLDLARQQLLRSGFGRLLDARDHGHRDREDASRVAVQVEVDGVLAGRDAARVRDLVVDVSRVDAVAEIVAQQVEDGAALVGIADRDVARRLHPQVDIGVDLVGPADLDDHVARRRDVVGGLGAGRMEVRQQHDHDGDEADQGEHDHVAEHRAAGVVLERVKIGHGALRSRPWRSAA
jgi:hypothetical protein